jgi:hypothetical protein
MKASDFNEVAKRLGYRDFLYAAKRALALGGHGSVSLTATTMRTDGAYLEWTLIISARIRGEDRRAEYTVTKRVRELGCADVGAVVDLCLAATDAALAGLGVVLDNEGGE